MYFRDDYAKINQNIQPLNETPVKTEVPVTNEVHTSLEVQTLGVHSDHQTDNTP